jgi:hypothetical protein
MFAFIMINACKTDSSKTNEETPSKEVDPVAEITRNLPDPCSFLDEAFVSANVDIPQENVTIKRGGDSPAVPAKSCFFKWSGGEVGNAGLMIQALGNPIPDEFPQWAFFFIDNKKSQGEISMQEPDVPNKFTTIDIGDNGCYNHKLAKCYFRKGETVFLIALNGISDDQKKIDIYRAVSERVLSMIK